VHFHKRIARVFSTIAGVAQLDSQRVSFRQRAHEIIFEAETPAGRAFDLALLVAIIASVAAVVLESIEPVRARFGVALRAIEWVFTIVFSIEYLLRLAAVHRPLRYATSFFGWVDLLSILPTYLSLFLPGAQSLLVIRSLRLLRVFRLLKLGRYLLEARVLLIALRASLPKITVFLGTVLALVLIMGAMMYAVEGPAHGFVSIPHGMYWAVVTLTTVGYGDLYPQTDLGRMLSAVVMVMGYGIIAVPTGIVTVELGAVMRKPPSTRACPHCSSEGHDPDAKYCKDCAGEL
jgi:voltage-gated potassium channel